MNKMARFAFVLWPDAYDKTLPCCITLDAVDAAVQRGAVLLEREWDYIAGDVMPAIDPAQSNPRRDVDDAPEDNA